MSTTEDQKRFREIIRGKIRKELGKYMSQPARILRQGRKKVSVPFPQVDLPRFKFDDKQGGGVGQGGGEEGDPLGPAETNDEEGNAGENPGDHALSVEFSIEEFIDLIAEELELPDLDDKGKKNIIHIRDKYTGIRRAGPAGLRHPKKTLREALKRSVSTGKYDPKKPMIVPEKRDYRYKASKPVFEEKVQAVIFYMMDVSGSMNRKKKIIARIQCFWINMWIGRNYPWVERVFIIHDVNAREVDEKTFFMTEESGGTKISSAYEHCLKMIEEEYPSSEWNIYLFHFSDGDNLIMDDKPASIALFNILRHANMFGYIQINPSTKKGRFWRAVRDLSKKIDKKIAQKIRLAFISSRDDTMKTLKKLFGKK